MRPFCVLMMLVFMSPQMYFSERFGSPSAKFAFTYALSEASDELTETM